MNINHLNFMIMNKMLAFELEVYTKLIQHVHDYSYILCCFFKKEHTLSHTSSTMISVNLLKCMLYFSFNIEEHLVHEMVQSSIAVYPLHL